MKEQKKVMLLPLVYVHKCIVTFEKKTICFCNSQRMFLKYIYILLSGVPWMRNTVIDDIFSRCYFIGLFWYFPTIMTASQLAVLFFCFLLTKKKKRRLYI